MSWNYRIVSSQDPISDEPIYTIREVYYDENDEVNGWTVDPIHPLGGSYKELKNDIMLMIEAFGKDILSEEELEKSINWKN